MCCLAHFLLREPVILFFFFSEQKTMKQLMKKTLVAGALSAALLITGCQHSNQTPAAQLQQLSVTTQQNALLQPSLLVNWSFTEQQQPVDIYVANNPEGSKQLVARNITGNSYLLPRDANARQYIFVQPKQGQGQWVAERVLPLQGGFNFRDLGGYPTQDGRQVQWGKLYRSGTMIDLTEQDYAYLGKLNLGVMCDFRSREELQQEPTAWKAFAPQAEIKVRDYPMREIMSSDGALRFDQVKTTEQAQEMFKSFYRTGPYRFKDSLSEMFTALADNKAPLAFNCSAGKDRTGMAAALLLSALNVPRATIVEDYALTEKVANFGLRDMQRRMRDEAAGKSAAAPHSGLEAMPRAARNVFMGSDPMFINAMFTALEKNHGSVHNFIRDELKISDAQIAQLQQLYLTAAN